MAAVAEAELDRSPSPSLVEEETEDVDLVDEHLLAEEREIRKKRLELKGECQSDVEVAQLPDKDSGAGSRLLELVGKSQLYSSWLADQFKDVVEQTLAATKGDDGGERPAKRLKTRRGKQPEPTATQRLLPMIHAEMRDYQLKGVAWLISLYKNGVNGILADEMGLGKTLQTIGFISYLWSHCKDTSGKYLVVGPLSTLSNWVAEFERFCPGIPVLLYHGHPKEREALRAAHMKNDGKSQMPVIVTSYEIVMADRPHLQRHVWKLAVIDEGHRLKNYDCKLLRELRCLNMESRLLLTGTPLQNNLRELWSLLSFCMPQVFANANQFMDWFDICKPASAIPSAVTAPVGPQPAANDSDAAAGPSIGKGRGRKKGTKVVSGKVVELGQASGGKELTPESSESQGGSNQVALDASAATAVMMTRLHAILKPFVLRRVKADVNIGVPPKQEIVLYAEMTEEQRRLTRGLIDGTLVDELNKASCGGPRTTLNNLIIQMRKVCNHPDLITGATSGCHTYPSAEELVQQCGKLALLHRLLKELQKEGHRVLIFSQMTKMLDVMEAYLDDLGIGALRIDGNVSWQQRKSDIADFQSGKPDKWVFLLSTRAGGLGINLTAADTVIIYDSDWNPHQDSQAMDRCHRIGQTKPVLVFRLVTSNSVENRMLAKADSKKALERIVIKKGAFKELLQTTSSTSAEELMQLLNPDRRSGDLAQSGVVTDDMLRSLLDRSHLAAAFEAQTGQAAQAAGDKKQAKAAGGEASAPEPEGPPLPPYPLVGVGYEVVMDEPRRAVGLLQTIDGDGENMPQQAVDKEPSELEGSGV